jgi:hypothetical protein
VPLQSDLPAAKLEPVQPVLVLPVYRGGAKLLRALASLAPSARYFRRIVVSLNSPADSPDARAVVEFEQHHHTGLEAIQTGTELPWMQHQYFWLEHLERTGEGPTSWVTWFAHDDQLRPAGLAALTGADVNWPLEPRTCYLGPWGMRYDPPGGMYDGPPDAPLESWTSFQIQGPLRLPVAEWIRQQLVQPTYINMSGCVAQLAAFTALRDFRVQKPGGMRIEMATAASPVHRYVAELAEPIVITHTSPVTDRTTYAKVARKDDAHLAAWLANYALRHPTAILPTARATAGVASAHLRMRLKGRPLPTEDWRRRTTLAQNQHPGG